MASKTKKKPNPARLASSIKQSSKVIRSKKNGCFNLCHSKAWGKYLIPTEDPLGEELSDYNLNGIQLNPDFPPIPAELWYRWIALCFHMCPEGKKLSTAYHDDQLEVQVCFLRDSKTLSKWKIVVPKQIVSGISVKSELAKNIDIETGEEYDQFPPEGWVHAGSSHSHNTMDAFFSSVDDRSELTVPGLHIVIGNIDHEKMEYTFEPSIVLRKMRKAVDLDKVVKLTPLLELDFHEDVLKYIETVVSANEKFYSERNKPIGGPSFSTDPMSLFDEDGKPDAFLYGLDRNNSDLFDDDNTPNILLNLPSDRKITDLVESYLTQGYSIDEIHQAIEAARDSLQDDDEEDEDKEDEDEV